MLKINFSDMWVPFNIQDNDITNILQNNSILFEISDNPDFLFYSVYGNKHLKFNCIKIFITGEAISPDFNYSDYAIGFDYITFKERYIRWPLYKNKKYLENLKNRQLFKSIPEEKTEFCSFVYSNNHPYSPRNHFFNLLNNYKSVKSGGKSHNNVNGPVKSKLDFEKMHKFSICFENAEYDGYTSEKLLDGFAANTIPIYYGNPSISEEFNTKSFINLHEFDSFEDAIIRIIEVDQNDEIYLEILNAHRVKYYDTSILENFILNIIKNPTNKVGKSFWTTKHILRLKLVSIIESNKLLVKIMNHLILSKSNNYKNKK